jgi:hypothetical protein
VRAIAVVVVIVGRGGAASAFVPGEKRRGWVVGVEIAVAIAGC